MIERDRWGLRGPVRACRLQRTLYSRRCGADTCEPEERSFIHTLDFREDGSLARHWVQNPDGSEWTSTYEYNDLGLLTSVRTDNGTGPADLRFYDYDSAGRLVRIIAQPYGGGNRIHETYEYDDVGRRKKTLNIDVADQRPDTRYIWGVEGTDTSYSAPGAAALTTLYNERGKPVKSLFYDQAGRLLSQVGFGYDLDGNLIEEAQMLSAETLPPELLTSPNQAQMETVRALFGANGEPIRRTHRYNEQGLRVETRSEMGRLGGHRKIMAYNPHGDEIEEVFEMEERDYGIDDEGKLSDAPTRKSLSRSEARSRYDYDANGNWVTKTVESRGGADQDFKVCTVEGRTISYFD
jgi:YD repeat-containing protein